MFSNSDDYMKFGLALMNIEGVGSIIARKISDKFPNLSVLFQNSSANNFECEGVPKVVFERIRNFNDFGPIENEIQFIKQQNIQVIFFNDHLYPYYLKQCNDAPYVLFIRGNINLNNPNIISLVGTRKTTSYGIGFVKEFIQEVKKYNPIIVSGFAYGVDICAHLAALENNLQTIAVLGHGFDQIYPKVHKKYVENVVENGGLISEFTTYDVFKKENFIKRNRIVAGLSKATLVIESAIKGGSLSTAKFANDYNRDVFALPGRTTDLQSAGCNYLIKTNQANLLTSVDDVAYYLNWDVKNGKENSKAYEIPDDLSQEELRVISYLQANGAEILDVIAIQTNIQVFKLSVLLLNLELSGLIIPLPGKLYDLKK